MTTSTDTSTEHRWNGWPGASCLDCGIEDPREQCLADHNYYDSLFELWQRGDVNEIIYACPEHVMPACPAMPRT